jgi:hypothetical protein
MHDFLIGMLFRLLPDDHITIRVFGTARCRHSEPLPNPEKKTKQKAMSVSSQEDNQSSQQITTTLFEESTNHSIYISDKFLLTTKKTKKKLKQKQHNTRKT